MKQTIARLAPLLRKAYRLPNSHGLDPRVFVGLSAAGAVVQVLYYLPWLRAFDLRLALLALLRTLALAGPAYVALRGRRVAALVNLTLVGSWMLGTAWHVCYFVYL